MERKYIIVHMQNRKEMINVLLESQRKPFLLSKEAIH